jgi:hypothetical protein
MVHECKGEVVYGLPSPLHNPIHLLMFGGCEGDVDSKLGAGASKFLAHKLGASVGTTMCEFGAFEDDSIVFHLWHILCLVVLQDTEDGFRVCVIKSNQGGELRGSIDSHKKIWKMAGFCEPELGGIRHDVEVDEFTWLQVLELGWNCFILGSFMLQGDVTITAEQVRFVNN